MSDRRLRVRLAYDGTAFAGWQRQPDARTVQGVVEAALSSVMGEEVHIVGAGRTDAGVHASGQVAHFDTRWIGSVVTLRRAANAVLPRDVAVRAIGTAPAGFHARYSATARRYRYRIWRANVRHPLVRRTSMHVPYALDVPAMAAAAQRLIGTRDFAALGRPVGGSEVTVRRLDRIEFRERGPALDVVFEGNAFLRHQVRRMIGLLIDVGRGKCAPEGVDAVLEGRPGGGLAWRAPARGLVLTHVLYPSATELLARTENRAPKERVG